MFGFCLSLLDFLRYTCGVAGPYSTHGGTDGVFGEHDSLSSDEGCGD